MARTCRIAWNTGIQRTLAVAPLSVCSADRTCRLTFRSSRDRFAARLHGDVYHSAVPRSGPA
jgi:hypothetical protein